MAMTWEEALEHAGQLMTTEVEERALRAIPHYIWMDRRESPASMLDFLDPDSPKRKRPTLVGFCTNCLEWHDIDATKVPDWVAEDPYATDEYGDDPAFEANRTFPTGTEARGKARHGQIGHCPRCGARAQYRSLNIGYKTLWDRAMLIIYQKSAIEKDAIVCVGYDIIVEWKHMNPYEAIYPPMDIDPAEVCVFRHGKSADRFIKERCAIWDMGEQRYTQQWVEWKHKMECKSGWAPGVGLFGNSRVRVVLDAESLQNAVVASPFSWIFEERTVEECHEWGCYDKISAMARIAKYPCIEYLFKLGFSALAKYAIDEKAGALLNLRGKSAKAVLRLTDQQWGEVKGRKLNVTEKTLEAAQFARREKLRWSMELCEWIGNRLPYGTMDAIEEIHRRHKQLNLLAMLKYCRRKSVRLRDYRDYLGQMDELRMNMADKTLLYPVNFDEMHGRLSERVAAKTNKNLEKKIKDMLPKLAEYCFSACGLVLRPMLTSGEVIREGTVLHHCVGGYVKQYANGQTTLCCLREETAMNKPLYTVEFGKEGRMVQCRGERNQTKPEDKDRLAQFWKLFEMMRADLRTQNSKVQKRKRKESAA